jgi:transposase
MRENGAMKTSPRLSTEVRQRAVQMYNEARPVHRSDWSVIESVASKIGCSPKSLHRWIGLFKDSSGDKANVSGSNDGRVAELEREVLEPKRANEILKLASAFSHRRS